MTPTPKVIRRRFGFITICSNVVAEFVVYRKYRGKGYARKLAALLPRRCCLVPFPIAQYGPGLNHAALIEFYKSIGFTWKNRLVMHRN